MQYLSKMRVGCEALSSLWKERVFKNFLDNMRGMIMTAACNLWARRTIIEASKFENFLEEPSV